MTTVTLSTVWLHRYVCQTQGELQLYWAGCGGSRKTSVFLGCIVFERDEGAKQNTSIFKSALVGFHLTVQSRLHPRRLPTRDRQGLLVVCNPEGSKYPTFQALDAKNHFWYGSWNQKHWVLGPSGQLMETVKGGGLEGFLKSAR